MLNIHRCVVGMVARSHTVALVGTVVLALGVAGCSSTKESTTLASPTPVPTPVPTPDVVAALLSLTLSSVEVQGQAQPIGTVTLTAAAPEGGAVVSLESSSGTAKVPRSVTVTAGTTTATFVIDTSTVGTRTPITLKAIYSDEVIETILTLTLQPPRASFTVTSERGSDVCILVNGGTQIECEVDASASDGILVIWDWTLTVETPKSGDDLTQSLTHKRYKPVTGTFDVSCEFTEGAVLLSYSLGYYVDMTVTLQVEDRDTTRSSEVSKMIKLDTNNECGFQG